MKWAAIGVVLGLFLSACGGEPPTSSEDPTAKAAGNANGQKWDLLIEWDSDGLVATQSYNLYRDPTCSAASPLTTVLARIPQSTKPNYEDKSYPMKQKQVCYEVAGVSSGGEGPHKRIIVQIP